MTLLHQAAQKAVEAPAIIAPHPAMQHATYCYAQHGDPPCAQFVHGWEALCLLVEEEVAAAEGDRWRDFLADTDEWGTDGNGVPFHYRQNFEDGSMAIYRMDATAALQQPEPGGALKALDEVIPPHLRASRHGEGFMGQRYDIIRHTLMTGLAHNDAIAALNELAALQQQPEPVVPDYYSGYSGWLWTHNVTGGEYRMIGTGKLQSSAPLRDMAEVVLYQGADGLLWARAAGEWDDRFKRLRPDPAFAAVAPPTLQQQEVPSPTDADGEAVTPQRLIAWLDAKYRRHGEEEDKWAADFIRSAASPSTTRQQEAGNERPLFDPNFPREGYVSDAEWAARKRAASTDTGDQCLHAVLDVVQRWLQPDGIDSDGAMVEICGLVDPLAAAPSTPENAGGVPDGVEGNTK